MLIDFLGQAGSLKRMLCELAADGVIVLWTDARAPHGVGGFEVVDLPAFNRCDHRTSPREADRSAGGGAGRGGVAEALFPSHRRKEESNQQFAEAVPRACIAVARSLAPLALCDRPPLPKQTLLV